MGKEKSKSKTHTELIREFDKRHENGCVIRCGKDAHNHRKNGYNYAKSNWKDYYNKDFTTQGEINRLNLIFGPAPPYFGHKSSNHRDPRHRLTAWHLTTGSNYQVGRWPFTNQAHHIIPISAFHHTFDFFECIWCQQCGYNINGGENIIILPAEERVGKAMRMLIHPTSHKDYNSAVQSELNKVKGEFARAKDDEEEGHYPLEEEDMPKVKDELEQFSKDTMYDIFCAGEEQPGSEMKIVSILSAR